MNARAASVLAKAWAVADAGAKRCRSPKELALFLRRNGAYTRAARAAAIAAYYAAVRRSAA